MDQSELESTPKESEKPRNPYIEFMDSHDWDDVRRVIREQKVPPGTPFLEYRNRIVLLRWDPIPLYTFSLPFGTIGEAMAYFGEASGGTWSDAGTTAQSNVSTSNEECFSLEDTPANADEDRSPSGEGALSNLRADCAEKSAGEEALSDTGSSAESNVSTGSEEYFSLEDTPANVEGNESPSGESALSNVHNLGPTLNHSTAQSSGIASDDNLADPVISKRLTRCNEILVNVPKSVERENVPEDKGGHQDITGESPSQEPVLDATDRLEEVHSRYEKHKAQLEGFDDEVEAIRKEISSQLYDLKVPVQDKKFQKTRNTPIGISTKYATAKRGSGEEMTENSSARRLVEPGTSIKTAPPKILTKKQKKHMLKQQERVNRMLQHNPRNQGSPIVLQLPFPKNSSDRKDWCKIELAMVKDNVAVNTDSYFFEGRNVPLGWRPYTLDQILEERNRQLLAKVREKAVTAGASTSKQDKVDEQKPEETRCDYARQMIAEKLDARRGRNRLVAGRSISKLDAVEEQSREEDDCTGGQPASYQDNWKQYKKKKRSKRNRR